MRSFLPTALLGFISLTAACQSAPAGRGAAAPPAQTTAAGQVYGAPVTPAGAVPVRALTTVLPPGQDSARVKLVGEVGAVCQAKGCWLTLQTAAGAPMRVRFKDYGFFVPKDLAGKTAVVDGWVHRALVPAAELRHYAQDAGRPAAEVAAITAPVAQYTFVADGVLVER